MKISNAYGARYRGGGGGGMGERALFSILKGVTQPSPNFSVSLLDYYGFVMLYSTIL